MTGSLKEGNRGTPRRKNKGKPLVEGELAFFDFVEPMEHAEAYQKLDQFNMGKAGDYLSS